MTRKIDQKNNADWDKHMRHVRRRLREVDDRPNVVMERLRKENMIDEERLAKAYAEAKEEEMKTELVKGSDNKWIINDDQLINSRKYYDGYGRLLENKDMIVVQQEKSTVIWAVKNATGGTAFFTDEVASADFFHQFEEEFGYEPEVLEIPLGRIVHI